MGYNAALGSHIFSFDLSTGRFTMGCFIQSGAEETTKHSLSFPLPSSGLLEGS